MRIVINKEKHKVSNFLLVGQNIPKINILTHTYYQKQNIFIVIQYVSSS